MLKRSPCTRCYCLSLLLVTARTISVAARLSEGSRSSSVHMHLRTGSVVLHAAAAEQQLTALRRQLRDISLGKVPAGPRQQQYLVSLHTGSEQAEAQGQLKAAVEAAGGFVCSYVPDHTFRIMLPAAEVQQLALLQGVAAVTEYTPEMKIAPEWSAILSWASQQPAGKKTSILARPGSSQHAAASLPQDVAGYLQQSQIGLRPADMVLQASVLLARPHSGGLALAAGATSSNDAAAVLKALQLQLKAVCKVAGRVIAPHKLLLDVPLPCLEEAIHWAAQQAAVHWIAPLPRTVSSNYLATGIVQSALAGALNPANSYGINSSSTHWLWNAGLQGQNMIVGMGDTGLDVFHCHFSDSSYPASSFQASILRDSAGTYYYDNLSHRKVRYYRFFKDNRDANGHGTHCAGSAMGAPEFGGQSNWSDYAGAAPLAKIAFHDLGDDTSGTIYPPDDLVNDFFALSYSRGARVHSDSWGTANIVAYDEFASQFDEFANRYQDFVPVVAAGNFGYKDVDSTVTSPAIAKNCIAVGAGLTAVYSNETERVTTDVSVLQMDISGGLPGSGVDGTVLYKVMQAAYGPSFQKLINSNATLRLTAATPNANGCTAYPRGTSLAGAAVLVTRGNCTFATKSVNAQKAGAAAVLISNNLNTGFFRMSQVGTDIITLPTGAIPQNSARALYNALIAGSDLELAFYNYTLPAERFQSMAYFSSIGPTLDGRYKPDIVAPGTTFSARTAATAGQSTCTLGLERGTSMATPITAGSVLLIRQYFTEGWYPSGAARISNAYVPSGPLMKAVLLGGAAQMEGIAPSSNPQYDGVPLDPTPSSRQGFGRVRLSTSLPLANGPSFQDTYAPNMQVVDRVPMLRSSQVDQYCVQATGNGQIKITLVWADPAADTNAAISLVNDLDLTVHADSLSGYSLRGNGAADRLNNVEQVVLDTVGSGVVVITVTGFAVQTPLGPQNYSLAVQGSFSGELESRYNPGWGGATTASCRLPITRITSGPATISNASAVSIFFNASEVPAYGFQCSLTRGGATSPAPLFDWRGCTSPYNSSSLADGRYLFQARANRFIIQDSRIFTIDRTPPVTSISSAVAAPPGNLRSASFAFTATDIVSVGFECRLSGVSNGVIQGVNQTGAWEACISPQQYDSIPSGNWSFSVRSTDVAGNKELAPYRTFNWTVSLANNYPVISTNATTSTSPTVSFSFVPFNASAAASTVYQCLLQVFDGSSFVTYTPAVNCTSPYVYRNLGTGLYQFTVAAAGGPAGQAATSRVSVMTSGPDIAILSSPAGVVSASTVTFTFSSPGSTSGNDAAADPISFGCQLQGSSVAASSVGFTPCTSPKQYARQADGNYIFLVQAVTASGLASAPAQYPFVIDTSPPSIDHVSFTSLGAATAATQTANTVKGTTDVVVATSFTLTYDINDGVIGSGVNRSYCFFDTPGNVQTQVAKAVQTRAAATLCPAGNRREYTSLASTYAFAIVSIDNANNYAQSSRFILTTKSKVNAGERARWSVGIAVCLPVLLLLLLM